MCLESLSTNVFASNLVLRIAYPYTYTQKYIANIHRASLVHTSRIIVKIAVELSNESFNIL